MKAFTVGNNTISVPFLECVDALPSEHLSNTSFPVLLKGTQQVLANVPQTRSDPAFIDSAISQAQAAQSDWQSQPVKERTAIMDGWYKLMLENKQALATLLVAEQGKPMTEAINEIDYAASFVKFYAQEVGRAYGTIVPPYATTDQRHFVIRQPVGLVLAITPWNFPSAMVTRKVAPALAAGCGVFLKPAPETPLSAIMLYKLALQAGLPEGLFSLLLADEENTPQVSLGFLKDARIAKLAFTGSTEVGKHLASLCAPTLKRISLELGGNGPLVVFEDADLDKAASIAVAVKFKNMGQTCSTINRIFVQESVHDAFVEKLVQHAQELTVGMGFEENVTQGPLINSQALTKVREHLEDALAQGALVKMGGKALGQTFFEPTILTNLTPSMRIFKEETFGPLAPIMAFSSEEEAIELANCTSLGLAAYLVSENLSRCHRVSEKLQCGNVGINTRSVSSSVTPFGGWKESGLGYEGGSWGLDAFLEIKHIAIGI